MYGRRLRDSHGPTHQHVALARARRTLRWHWDSAHTLGFGTGAVVLLAGFVARQASATNPLRPLRIFSSRTLVGANLIPVLMMVGRFGMFFLGARYPQRVLAYDAMTVGLAFRPVAVAIGALSLDFSARLTTRFGSRVVLRPGLTLIRAGLVRFARAPV